MKKILFLIAVALTVTACSATKPSLSTAPQRIATSTIHREYPLGDITLYSDGTADTDVYFGATQK